MMPGKKKSETVSIRPPLPGGRDWIVAPATPPGHSAIAVARLDGPGCWAAAARVWRPLPSSLHQGPLPAPPAPPAPRRLTLGEVGEWEIEKEEKESPSRETRRGGRTVDQVLLAWFPGPNSYTGNDLVEFHCHGSPGVVRTLIESLLSAGARMARPGEFTERAFFNGRLDLAQAEGVANLVAARTREAGRAALLQLRGALSREVSAIRESLLDLAAEIEARLDFPEEEIEPADRRRLEGIFLDARARLERLRATARRGKLLRDGARVAIAGKPNAGKSSVFNELVGLERAIVTPHPGTTRDTIEATLDVRGIPMTLIDTAGVTRNAPEAVERLGVERALREIQSADMVLFVLDGGVEPDEDDATIYAALAGPHLLIVNKSDLPPAASDARLIELFPKAARLLRVSALRGEGFESLENGIAEEILKGSGAPEREPERGGEAESPTVINLRHAECLDAALDALERARDAFEAAQPGELVMVDIYAALERLGEILGISVDDAVLSRIFSRFCIGK